MFDLGRLEILFKRVGSLPPLPAVVKSLLDAIDGDQASAFDLEKIIMTDPVLVTEIMRSVGSSPVRLSSQIGSLRHAIILLGHRSIRAIAIGLSLKALTKLGDGCKKFDAAEFAEHSSQVAILARYFYSRGATAGRAGEWTIDEVYAAALLHDFGFALLAHVDPETYDRLWALAQVLQISLDEAFYKCCGSHVGILGAAACQAWGLPDVFFLSQRYFQEPILSPKHVRAMSCICFANYAATTELQGTPMQLPPYVPDLVRVPSEELPALFEALRIRGDLDSVARMAETASIA